jgi:PEP-CTERM motif
MADGICESVLCYRRTIRLLQRVNETPLAAVIARRSLLGGIYAWGRMWGNSMKEKPIGGLIISLLFLVFFVMPSSAVTLPSLLYTWSWTDTYDSLTGGGTLTTDGGIPGCGAGCETITNVTGNIFGEQITQFPGHYPYDNKLFPSSDPLLDGTGFSFDTPTYYYEVYWYSPLNTYVLWQGLESTYYYGAFTVSVAQTPLPATLPLFATGLGALGLVGWHRKRKKAALADCLLRYVPLVMLTNRREL